MADDLEVFWNGVNDGRDGDLLRVDLRVPDKREGFTEKRINTARGIITDALRQGTPLTYNDLVVVTGFPMGTINAEIYRLRLEGRVAFRDSGRFSTTGRRLREYWLEEGSVPGASEVPAPAAGSEPAAIPAE